MPQRTYSEKDEIFYDQVKADTGIAKDTGNQNRSNTSTSERVSTTKRDQTSTSNAVNKSTVKANKAFNVSFSVKVRTGFQGVSSDSKTICQ